MEIDPRYIGLAADEPAQRSSSEELSHESNNARSSHSSSTSDGDRALNPSETLQSSPYHRRKWNRLRKHYSDQYLELFNTCCNEDLISKDTADLLESQLGAVTWTSNEKKQLFAAIAQFSRHDLPQLTNAVATKSAIEILAYIGSVHQAHIDRQLFRPHPKNVSIADIPAAIEIGPDCEADLEKAADALNAYQEQYDLTAIQKEGDLPWLIDHATAAKLDVENDNIDVHLTEELEEDRQEPANQQSLMGQQLFHLSEMLDLSERFFMNHSAQSSHPHWKSIAERKQRPAMTSDCVQALYDLVIEQLRQILRVSIQVADTRLSSMTTNGYSPSHKLSQSDVATALDILNMPRDAWDFWTRMARRNGQQIITGSHSKGEARAQFISYENAEALLSIRRGRGRRRSMSTGSETSSAASNLSKLTGSSSGLDNEGASEDVKSAAESDNNSVLETDEVSTKLEEQSESEELSSTDSEVSDRAEDKTSVNRNQRRIRLEEKLEEYTEKLDQAARSVEENKLWQVLGKRQNVDVEEEEHELGPRPKSLRKTKEELGRWSCKYVAEWEYFGELPLFGEANDRHQDKEVEAEVGTDVDNSDGSS